MRLLNLSLVICVVVYFDVYFISQRKQRRIQRTFEMRFLGSKTSKAQCQDGEVGDFHTISHLSWLYSLR